MSYTKVGKTHFLKLRLAHLFGRSQAQHVVDLNSDDMRKLLDAMQAGRQDANVQLNTHIHTPVRPHAPNGPCKICGDVDDHYGTAHSSVPQSKYGRMRKLVWDEPTVEKP